MKNKIFFGFLGMLLVCCLLFSVHRAGITPKVSLLGLPAIGKEIIAIPVFSNNTLFPSLYIKEEETTITQAAPPVSVAASPTPNYVPTAAVETIAPAGVVLGNIQIKNETDYMIDMEAAAQEALSFPPMGTSPAILILHTHATEAYTPTDAMPYIASSEYRTRDTARNVTAVGKRIAERLNAQGISTLNDATLNDDPVYSYSYKNSLALAESHLMRGNGTALIIDLHRDALQTEDGTWLRTAFTLLDGRESAQIMLVVGTDANGLSNPNWRRNLSFAAHLQQELESRYPGITRPVNIRCERFNSHVGNYQILIEIGTNANTLEEALIAADCLSEALAALFT